VTDEDPNLGMVFMSARPEEEHHEVLLCGGRNVDDRDAMLLQQVSFRCDSLEDVVGFYNRLKEHDVQFDMVVSHGNAVGVYFRDPEGNRLEVYCATGLRARQPYLERVDLTARPRRSCTTSSNPCGYTARRGSSTVPRSRSRTSARPASGRARAPRWSHS
jgi:hypothetical protein